MSFDIGIGTPRDTAWSDWQSRKDQRETAALLESLGARRCRCGQWFRPRKPKRGPTPKYCRSACRFAGREDPTAAERQRRCRERKATRGFVTRGDGYVAARG